MLIPYSFIEQQWRVSWMKSRKRPLSKSRLTAWETPGTSETRELSERRTSDLYQLRLALYYFKGTLMSPWRFIQTILDCGDSEAEDWMGGGVQRRTTQARQKLTQRTYTSTWISEPPESTDQGLNRALQKPEEWVTRSRCLLTEHSINLEEHKRQN